MTRRFEVGLLYSTGTANSHLPGVTLASGITSVSYTTDTPTGSGLWPILAQTAGQRADLRRRPPECWMMRTSRWSWLMAQEDLQGRPFGLSPLFMGQDAVTPDPIGGLMGWPVFLNENVSATLGTAANEDENLCVRPRDIVLLESAPTTNVYREVLSGSLSARIQMHTRVAAVTRYVSGVAVVSGSGLQVASGY
jgi:hypothetical protein